jgi:hypothetical protein
VLDRYLVEFALLVVREVVKRLLQVVILEVSLHRLQWYLVVLTLLHPSTIHDHLDDST